MQHVLYPHAILVSIGLDSVSLHGCVSLLPLAPAACYTDPKTCPQDYQDNPDNLKKTGDMEGVEFEHFFNEGHRKVGLHSQCTALLCLDLEGEGDQGMHNVFSLQKRPGQQDA